MERPLADSVEKPGPASDVDTAVVDSLKALDPNRPIREADISEQADEVAEVPIPDLVPSRQLNTSQLGLILGLDRCQFCLASLNKGLKARMVVEPR